MRKITWSLILLALGMFTFAGCSQPASTPAPAPTTGGAPTTEEPDTDTDAGGTEAPATEPAGG